MSATAANRAALIGAVIMGSLLLGLGVGIAVRASERRERELRVAVEAQLDSVVARVGARLRQIEMATHAARESVRHGLKAQRWQFGEPNLGIHMLEIRLIDASGRDVWDADSAEIVPATDLRGEPRSVRWVGPWTERDGRMIMGFLVPVERDPKQHAWVGTLFPLDLVWPDREAGALGRAGLLFNVARPDMVAGSRVIARGEPRPIPDAVQTAIPLVHGGWRLEAAPRGGWSQRYVLAAHLTLACLLALAAAVALFELLRKPQHLRAELEEQLRALRITYQRLVDEMKRRREIDAKISFDAAHDELTGLPNRERMLDRLERALQRARAAEQYHVAVLFVGVDRFKYVNDSLGTEAGDHVLVEVARRIDQSLRPGDTLARLGGDTFGAVLYDVAGESAVSAARRVRDAMGEPVDLDGQQIYTSVSVGIAASDTGYDRAAELLKQAEMAMYRAKADGGAQFARFDPSLREQAADRLQLETDLRRAIEREEFILYYQPVVSLDSGGIVGMEVLVRWQHPLEGLIAPGRFIGAAEETGLICQMNRWILRRAAEQAQEWRNRGVISPEFYLSVNLSAKDFNHADLCEYVQSVIDETSTPARAIRLEITEGMLMHNVAGSLATVEQLREMRIPLLLDDFGTGYSSLSYLHRFRFDYLKIDRSFTARVVEGGIHMGIVRAILNLSGDLGLKTIAEGIEDAVHLRFLRDLGCEYGQGYYFARPAPAAEAERLVMEQAPLVGSEELARSF